LPTAKPNSHFDRLIAIHVLEHLPNLPRAIDECHRVLKLGGKFAVVIPCDPGLGNLCKSPLVNDRGIKRAG
jgi:ubiquinone/menaquinone biosynthesis C-methylase UbiE